MFPLFGVQNFLGNVGDRPSAQRGEHTSNFGELELGDRTPKITPTPSMSYAKNIAFINLMRQYLEPLSLEISPDSLS
jgi:hypothetical protein